MGLNFAYVKFLFICICVSFVFTCVIGLLPLSIENCVCDLPNDESVYNVYDATNFKAQLKHSNYKHHKLAVLVPYRERFEELLVFVPHISKFLSKQNIYHHIFILNQIDRYRFNRASLINAGYLETQANFDYIAMHDVDLLPLNNNLSYEYPEKGPFHIAGPAYHPKYHYPTFVGGILLLNRIDFKSVGGMSNQYWGWGLEDDEFYVRIKEAGLVVTRPVNLTTGIENTFKHIHDRTYRRRDTTKCFNQREVTRKRDRKTGLHNVKYVVENVNQVIIDGHSATILNINLFCNKTSTPWCECGDATHKSGAIKLADKNKRLN